MGVYTCVATQLESGATLNSTVNVLVQCEYVNWVSRANPPSHSAGMVLCTINYSLHINYILLMEPGGALALCANVKPAHLF